MRNRQVKYPRRGKVTPPRDACKMCENDYQEWKWDTDFQIAGAESNTGNMRDDEKIPKQLARDESVTADLLNPRAAFWEHDVYSRIISDTAARKLDDAIVYHQSDQIVSARESVRGLFKILSINQAHCFEIPTKYGLQILNRGRQLFLEEGVSCSIKHGTLLLDSSTSGAQFYAGLLNVLAEFSLLISEFEIVQKTFDLLLQLHLQSNTTSRLQDLGAAYNNKGCVHLIMGDFQEAEQAFKTSLENFCLSESFLAETKVFAVNSNISRLNLISRNYPQALDQQEKLVKICQATEMKGMPYPFEVVFTVMNNQAVLHTTLNDFNGAENALRWLVSYCKDVDRQDSLYLVTFLRLHLSEVLLLHGKPKEADEVFSIETLNSLEDVVDRFGNFYMNVRTDALEKLLAVYICKGKIKTALELLQTTVETLTTVFGEDHFNVASLLYEQGKLLSITGEFLSAAAKFKSSRNILRQIFGVKNPLLLKCYLSLGDVTSILGRKEESYVYYQRAIETIEAIFQVSFVEELSIKYMEVIQGYQTFQRQRVSEHGIESLVAEYGHVLATLLNHECNRHLRKCRADGKRVTAMKTAGPCSIARSTLSLKYSLDFLKSGRKLLRYGMIEEAVIFFQQADMHCGAHVIKGHPDVSVVRLHNIFLRRKRNIHETLESDNNLKNFLKALGKVMEEISSESIVEETTGVAPMTGFDHKQDLKPVIISLLLFCIELKMIETTFEAYDLYCKLFQNETDSPLLLFDGIQVYASRTVITCNGKTALQDILISSEIGQKENDVEGDSADIQLFRNLECMEYAPRNAFLVASKSPVFLDIDDFHALKEKISLAVQECFQRTCFEAEDKSRATQVIVDLTPLATCDIFSTGSRISLLPLCLLELPSTVMPHKETIFEIETSMRQTITRMNFDDEQTSCFMFNKIALQLLQQSDLRRSSIALSSQSFSLTVPHPKKTRVIMSRSGKLITQKIQFVTTRTANTGSTDALSWILGLSPLHTVEKYRVPFRERTSSEASLDQSVTFCETNDTSNHKWKWAKKSSQVCKGEMVSQFTLHRDIYCVRLALCDFVTTGVNHCPCGLSRLSTLSVGLTCGYSE